MLSVVIATESYDFVDNTRSRGDNRKFITNRSIRLVYETCFYGIVYSHLFMIIINLIFFVLQNKIYFINNLNLKINLSCKEGKFSR